MAVDIFHSYNKPHNMGYPQKIANEDWEINLTSINITV